jgi:Myb-like DNA-binding domain
LSSSTTRNGKQCRERYLNHLRPDIKKGRWTKEEEAMIMFYHEKFGNKWSAMAQIMKNRTDNDIKNKFYSMNRTAQRKKRDEEADAADETLESCPSTIAAQWAADQSSIPYTQQANVSFDEQPAFVPRQRPQTQPLFAGNSLFNGNSQLYPPAFWAPPYPQNDGIAQSMTSEDIYGGSSEQQIIHPCITAANYWEMKLDF